MLVNDILVLPNISPFTLIRSLMVNWSNGLLFQRGKKTFIDVYKFNMAVETNLKLMYWYYM